MMPREDVLAPYFSLPYYLSEVCISVIRDVEMHSKPGRASLSQFLACRTDNGPDGSRHPDDSSSAKSRELFSRDHRDFAGRNREQRKLGKNYWQSVVIHSSCARNSRRETRKKINYNSV